MDSKKIKLFAIIGSAVLILFVSFIVSSDIKTSEESGQSQSSSSKSSESYSSDDSSGGSIEESSFSSSNTDEDKNPNSYKTGITYEQIARTPDEFESKKLQFTGKVLQVMEDDDDTQVRLAVDGDYKNVILVDITKDLLNNSRVLEDDLLTVSGISKGTTSYKSTGSGKITIPAMSAKIVNDQGKASDDYGE